MIGTPHDLGPWDDLLQTVSLDELRPALQRACAALERQGQPVPRWVRWLGPWTRAEAFGRAWVRKGGEESFSVSRSGGLWYQHALGIITYDSMHEAMAAEDEYATGRGYLFDPTLPEEAPAAEPAAPEPTEEAEEARAQAVLRGPGRRAGQHSWRQIEILAEDWGRRPHPVALDRCEGCGLWRVGGTRYFAAAFRRAWIRTVWQDSELAARKAGQCPGRRT